MKRYSNLDTGYLMSGLEYAEQIYARNEELMQKIRLAIKENLITQSAALPLLTSLEEIVQTYEEITKEIELELDRRHKKKLGVKWGIKTLETNINKFRDLMKDGRANLEKSSPVTEEKAPVKLKLE